MLSPTFDLLSVMCESLQCHMFSTDESRLRSSNSSRVQRKRPFRTAFEQSMSKYVEGRRVRILWCEYLGKMCVHISAIKEEIVLGHRAQSPEGGGTE